MVQFRNIFTICVIVLVLGNIVVFLFSENSRLVSFIFTEASLIISLYVLYAHKKYHKSTTSNKSNPTKAGN